jgi:hypothetical protein
LIDCQSVKAARKALVILDLIEYGKPAMLVKMEGALKKIPCHRHGLFHRMTQSLTIDQEELPMARIRHLAILTEDVEKLVQFYTSAFGLKVVHGIGTATYLSDGHINLAIIPIEPERKIEGPELKPGIYHFGFEVENVDALRDR